MNTGRAASRERAVLRSLSAARNWPFSITSLVFRGSDWIVVPRAALYEFGTFRGMNVLRPLRMTASEEFHTKVDDRAKVVE